MSNKGNAPLDIRSLARKYTTAALRTLGKIVKDESAPHAARVSASIGLLDRGWGKPQQNVEMTIHKPVRELADDELTIIAAGSSERTTEAPSNPPVLN